MARARLLPASAATAALALTVTGCSSGPEPLEIAAPAFEEVTVHDPSAVSSGEELWVFGSHGASASTTDLVSWTQESVDLWEDSDNPLFEDIHTELAETFEWAQTDTLWAADVIQLPDGRFAYYYNACEGSSPRSALGVAIADDVSGPYVDQGILLKSGMWDEESENPGEIYDATIHPNAVDPDAFYDADGKLWMVYGSYSGGIFILEMDEATGTPLPGQGYGTHLVGGNHSRIEAPSIRYDETTGYYYLFLSFGGLDASGGYEVRVARAETPDGPYLDANGVDMATVMGAPGTTFDDASIQDFGVKLIGGHEWADAGLPGVDSGYVSPGHNTWYDDPETGQSFLIFHSRFPATGEVHFVRTHQMFMNADGWPVLSPGRYGGETLAESLSTGDLEGGWQVIAYNRFISPFGTTSVPVAFDGDGNATGEMEGTLRLTGDGTQNLELELDGVSYLGVVTPVWNASEASWTLGLTALSEDGVALWGRMEVAE